MTKKIIVVFAVFILGISALIEFGDRGAIMTFVIKQGAELRDGEIQPFREVSWQKPEVSQLKSKNPETELPNIVLILTDDMGFNDISLYGGGAAGTSLKTPNIDSIAHEGVRFENGYAGNSVCAPSRAMLMSGRYSTRFGFEFTPAPPGMLELLALSDFFYGTRGEAYRPRADSPDDEKTVSLLTELDSFDRQGMPSSEITLAEQLKRKGYYTAHIGKWHLGRAKGLTPNDQGFDDSLLMASGLYLPEDHPNVVNSKQKFDNIDNFLWASMRFAASFNGSEWFEPRGYITDYYTDEAVRVIEQNKERPFFLYLAHWGIHTPLQATKEDYESLAHIDNHTQRVYAAMIKALDRSTGRVLQALKDNGLKDNTLVIFTSDNGGAGYVGLSDINKPFRGWKMTHFEGGTHVPYLAKWPRKIPPASVYPSPVSHLDIFATVSAAAGVDLPEDRVIDGVDFIPYVTGEIEEDIHETLVWRQGDLQTILHQGWKLLGAKNPDRLFLFNLKEDPTEQNNLVDQHPEKISELQIILDNHNSQQVDSMWPSKVKIPVAIDKTLNATYGLDEVIYFPN